MSDAPRPPEPEDAPSADELRRIAVPAHVRRAPRFARVVGTGVAAGFAAGGLCGLLLPNSTGVGRGMVAILVGLGFALIGGIVTGMIAVGLDRGTPRYLKDVRAGEERAAQTVAGEPDDDGDGDVPDDGDDRIGPTETVDDVPPSDAADPAAASAPDPEERP